MIVYLLFSHKLITFSLPLTIYYIYNCSILCDIRIFGQENCGDKPFEWIYHINGINYPGLH